MVRIPSFTRRPDTPAGPEPTATRPSHSATVVADRPRADQVDEVEEVDRGTTDSPPVAVREQVDDRVGYRGRAEVPVAPDTTDGIEPAQPDVVDVPAGPRPRASLLATLGLVCGVVAAVAVLTGVLAGYGIALGVIGLFPAIGGLAATNRRHVTGKSNAVVGLILCVGAMVFGGLALTGALAGLTTEINTVDQVRAWLDTQFSALV